jgi:hypothetical protein
MLSRKQICYLAAQLPIMRYMKWIGLAAAIILIISCFLPWSVISSQNIVVSGTGAEEIKLGKPGYGHFLLAGIFVLFSFIRRVWAKQWNLFIAALNLAWAIRNFFVFSGCVSGDCPDRQLGLWLTLGASVLLMVAALFPDINLVEKKTG